MRNSPASWPRHPICFDLSIFELFAPLSWGGTVILAQDALDGDMGESWEGVTLINTVPSVMGVLLSSKSRPASLMTVNLAGEPLKPALVDAIYQRWPVRRVNDLYGPTETTTYSTWTTRQSGTLASIGKPIANTQVYVLDTAFSPLPVGQVGELYIGGLGVARGYLHRPELTAERFVPDPFSADPAARLYRTGDVARWRDDGTLEYVGRRDQQVKIRGFRIELGEIEAALETHADVQAAAVVAQSAGEGEKRLVAFLVLSPGATVSGPTLRAWLSQTLPEYMLPTRFAVLEALPLTPNGKVDRQTLERTEGQELAVGTDYVHPQTELESQLAHIWQELLRLERVGIHDNFFQLGGHSLLALSVISRIRSQLDRDVPLRWLFEHPTVAGLACQIEASNAAPCVVEPIPRGSAAAITYVLRPAAAVGSATDAARSGHLQHAGGLSTAGTRGCRTTAGLSAGDPATARSPADRAGAARRNAAARGPPL